MTVQTSIVKAILDSETNPIRFERFCIDICSNAEGIEIVGTSRTWDLGRDGRSLGTLKGTYDAVLLATLESNVDEKIQSDIARLADTTSAKTIIFCTSQPLSEHKVTEIESYIRKNYEFMESVRVHGQHQLITLAGRYEDVFNKHYGAEISDIELIISKPTPDLEEAQIGLRLALLTHESEDAMKLREELARRLILDNLYQKPPLSPEQVGGEITSQLHLPRTISTHYTRQLLNLLKGEGLVIEENSKFKLTDNGNEIVRNVPEEASMKLLEGRIAVRNEIESLIGKKISDDHYEKLWAAFQDNITDLFYNHGLAIVKMIRSALSEESWAPEKASLQIRLDDFAERVASVTDVPELKDEIQQAFVDMFFEKDSEAFKWLTQVCGVYVMMCTLGFETFSSQQIGKVLACLHLVPDSDIVISLLCVGEDNHQDVERIVRGWQLVGGPLYATRPILEEVAYHAWISEYDYNLFGDELQPMSDNEARRLIDNAFVRSFRKEASSSTDRKNWNEYIKQYRGHTELDYEFIQEHLISDYSFGIIAELDDTSENISGKVRDYIVKRLCKERRCRPTDLDHRLIGKALRDSRLINTVYMERKKARSEPAPRTYCIVSSAKLIKEVDDAFRSKLGDPEMVLSLAAIGFLLTLTPQVQMGFSTLKAILFDTYFSIRLPTAQKFAYSVITSTGKWEVPWARRMTLHRQLQNILHEQSRSLGKPVQELRESLYKPENAETTARMIGTALERMAIHPKSDEEIRKLESIIKELEGKLVVESRLRKTRPKYPRGKPKHFQRRKK